MEALLDAVRISGTWFIFIIDEWDALFREAKDDSKLQEEYVKFLRGLFKDSVITDRIVEACYMTGILPIKKYGTQSALTDFNEYTMINPGPFAAYFGFTEIETEELCHENGLSFKEVGKWYDGYEMDEGIRIFNPKSVMDCVTRQKVDDYWTESETFESLKIYIDMNLDGLREALIQMIGGSSVLIDTGTFQNDMTSVKSRDDVLTLLIHLGYLSYSEGYVRIPNEEVRREFLRAIKADSHSEITRLVKNSDKLLIDTINGDEEAVASAMEEIHNSGTAILQYNDEQALRSVVKFAYISCVNDYAPVEEMPSGKGFADLVYIPKKTTSLPALLIELKWNKSAETALNQIRQRHYPDALKNYVGNVLLVGINYDKETKKHTCRIEKA